MLSWLLIVWRLVACGAAGYRVPDMHHLRWTPRKAALVPKQSCFKCQKRFSRLNGPIRPLLVCKTTATGSSFGVRHENVPNEGPVWNPFGIGKSPIRLNLGPSSAQNYWNKFLFTLRIPKSSPGRAHRAQK